MKKLLSALMITAVGTASYALPVPFEFKAGIGYTWLSPSGYVSYGDNYQTDEADLEKDLHLGDSNNISAYVQFGLPVLPNIRLEYLPTKFDGTGKATKTIHFGDITISGTDRVKTKIDIKQYDLDLFYRIHFPFIQPRIGLAVKYLDGYIDIKTLYTRQHEHVDINIPLPLVYAGANIDVPIVPLQIDVEGKGITYDGSYAYDIKAIGKLVVKKLSPIAEAYVGLGYRYQRYRLKDVDVDGKNLNSDIKFKGPFIEAGFAF